MQRAQKAICAIAILGAFAAIAFGAVAYKLGGTVTAFTLSAMLVGAAVSIL